jgi:uncharacterized protein (TIGR02391 family)
MPELEELAEKIQGGTSYPPETERRSLMDELAPKYMAWYMRSRALLHPDLRDKFEALYETARMGNIKAFFTLGADLHSANRGFGRYQKWRAPYGQYFKENFAAQKTILQESLAKFQAGDYSGTSRESVQQQSIFDQLHPSVKQAVQSRFSNGHYNDAISRTCIALNKAVQTKSGLSIDNTRLMQKAFSADDPIINVSIDKDERLGVMWLFSGMAMALRNPRAHHTLPEPSPQEALEILGFLSMLWRTLDKATA